MTRLRSFSTSRSSLAPPESAMTWPSSSPRSRTSRRSGAGISWRAASRLVEDRVLKRVDEREQRRLDDVARAAHRGPSLGVSAGFDEHARRRCGARVSVQDAHLVIVQAYVFEQRESRAQSFAQGAVEACHRTVARRRGAVNRASYVAPD